MAAALAGSVAAAFAPASAGAQVDLFFRPIEIRFRAVVGEAPFTCGRSYELGTNRTTAAPSDAKLYVHNVIVVSTDRIGYPVAITADSLWQTDDVALLDFEDGTGPCSNGTPQTNAVVKGSIALPEGTRIAAVVFTVGIPEKENHGDLASAPPPLALSRMFWAWNTGHKFLRVDLNAKKPEDWVMHLGSMGCGRTISSTTCELPNEATIQLGDFDPDHDTILFDIGALFKSASVGDRSGGCMSGAGDSTCVALYGALGLPFNGSSPGEQTVFRVRHEQRSPERP